MEFGVILGIVLIVIVFARLGKRKNDTKPEKEQKMEDVKKGENKFRLEPMGSSTELFIFSRENNLEKIMGTFMESFGMPGVDVGNQLSVKNNSVGINIVTFLPTMGEDYPEFIKDQKNRVMGHFAEIRNCDADIQLNLIKHLQHCHCFIDCKLECFMDDAISRQSCLEEMVGKLTVFLKKVDGVLLVNGATSVLDADGKLILSDEGETELLSYFPFAYVENPEFLKESSLRQMQRRNENMKYLFDKHIFVMELPINDDDEKVTLRSKEEMVKRMFGVMLVSLYSECLLNPAENMSVPDARAFIGKVIREHGISSLEDVLTPDELAYINDDNSEEKTRIKYSWHYEHLYTLEWALGLDEWMDVTGICDVPKSVRILNGTTIEKLCNEVIVRSKKEILDKADLVYRMDWACVDARIYGLRMPGNMDPGVVNARHKTLNWIIRLDDAEWDDVSTNT